MLCQIDGFQITAGVNGHVFCKRGGSGAILGCCCLAQNQRFRHDSILEEKGLLGRWLACLRGFPAKLVVGVGHVSTC